MTLGGAAQVAAAHCPNERTLDPAIRHRQTDRQTDDIIMTIADHILRVSTIG